MLFNVINRFLINIKVKFGQQSINIQKHLYYLKEGILFFVWQNINIKENFNSPIIYKLGFFSNNYSTFTVYYEKVSNYCKRYSYCGSMYSLMLGNTGLSENIDYKRGSDTSQTHLQLDVFSSFFFFSSNIFNIKFILACERNANFG